MVTKKISSGGEPRLVKTSTSSAGCVRHALVGEWKDAGKTNLSPAIGKTGSTTSCWSHSCDGSSGSGGDNVNDDSWCCSDCSRSSCCSCCCGGGLTSHQRIIQSSKSTLQSSTARAHITPTHHGLWQAECVLAVEVTGDCVLDADGAPWAGGAGVYPG